MSGKFSKVPVDDDTAILSQTAYKLGEYDALYQKWVWEGITGESIIFSNEDISDFSEEDIVNNVKTSSLLKKDTQITFKRSEAGYTFVNFNFETD